MTGKASDLSRFLTGKVVLALFVVTAATGGFLLGYFVGKSVSSPTSPSAAMQPVREGETAPVAVPGPNPVSDGSSPAVPVVQGLSAENKQAEPAPPVPEKTPVKGEARDKGTGVKDVPEPAGSSSGKVAYTVQAGAFRNQKDAEALKHKLEAKGYKIFIKKEPNSKGVVLFKVRTGEFEKKKEASVSALKLKKTDGLNAFAVEKK